MHICVSVHVRVCAYLHMCLPTCGLHIYTQEILRAKTTEQEERWDVNPPIFHHNCMALGEIS